MTTQWRPLLSYPSTFQRLKVARSFHLASVCARLSSRRAQEILDGDEHARQAARVNTSTRQRDFVFGSGRGRSPPRRSGTHRKNDDESRGRRGLTDLELNRLQLILNELKVTTTERTFKLFEANHLRSSPVDHQKFRSAYESGGFNNLKDEITSCFGLFASMQVLNPEQIQEQKRLANMCNPAEWFPLARAMHRKLHLHVGPTNSGKTYQALQRLQAAKSGCFAGPLRLLAYEIYAKFNGIGVPCNLRTGEETRVVEGATIISSTIEMLSTIEEMDILVIDEIQMIADPERGSAWTQALLGACAKEIHMCGEASVVELISKIAASIGETVEVHHYERLGSLVPMNESLGGTFKAIEQGDAIVTFSRANIFDIKRTVEQSTGKKCAVVYGGLPPEARAAQARLFNEVDNEYDVIVASDAIGMGLNLSIKRVVFETLTKWNGREETVLPIPQIKQIAGRAGRFKAKVRQTSKEVTELDPQKEVPGYVTTLRPEDLSLLHTALATPTIQLSKAILGPLGEMVEIFARPYPRRIRLSMVIRQLQAFAVTSDIYTIINLTSRNEVLDLLHPIEGLSFQDRWTLSDAPIRTRDAQCVAAMLEMARKLGDGRLCEILELENVEIDLLDEDVPESQERLGKFESLHTQLTLYLWLSIRFPGIFVSMTEVYQLRQACEEVIEEGLELIKARRRAGVAERQFVSRGMQFNMRRRNDEKPSRRRSLPDFLRDRRGILPPSYSKSSAMSRS